MIYNNVRDGAWCSGSTWASDSHCVGSIPIAPANANNLTCEGVSFILPHDLCKHKVRNSNARLGDVLPLCSDCAQRKHTLCNVSFYKAHKSMQA